MNAGSLTYRLVAIEYVTTEDPLTGEKISEWIDRFTMRAERIKLTGKAVVRGSESVIEADAAYYVRIQHPIKDGWRVRELGGDLYDVVVEPNREKQLKILKCKKVND